MSVSPIKRIYRVFRSIIFTVLLLAAAAYIALYVSLSLPSVRQWIKGIMEKEFESRSSGRLEIGDIEIAPFSEATLSDVKFIHPDGSTVVHAKTVGAGINLWKLVFEKKIQITYAEIISLDAHIAQEKRGGEYNIQFIIDAFKSKEKKKEPTKFDLVLNNIVIRRANVTFDRNWMPRISDKNKIDFNHLVVQNLAADLRLPRLRNDDFIIDLRRMSFAEAHGLNVQSLTGRFHITNKQLSFNDLSIRLPGTQLKPNNMTLRFNGYDDIANALQRDPIRLRIKDNLITPSDFRAFVPELSHYSSTYTLSLDAMKSGQDIDIIGLDVTSASGLDLKFKGKVASALNPKGKDFGVKIPVLHLDITGAEISKLIDDFSPLDANVNGMIRAFGDVKLDAAVSATLSEVQIEGALQSAVGDLVVNGAIAGLDSPKKVIAGTISTSELAVAKVYPASPVESVKLNATVDAIIDGKDFDGSIDADVTTVSVKGVTYKNLVAHLTKSGNHYKGETSMHDTGLDFDISGDVTLQGEQSHFAVKADIGELDFSRLNIPSLEHTRLSGLITADFTGNNIDNADGRLEVFDISVTDPRIGGTRSMHNIAITSSRHELPYSLTIDCDYFRAELDGNFTPTGIPGTLMAMLSKPLPDIIPAKFHDVYSLQDFALHLKVFKDSELMRQLNLPISFFEDIVLNANVNSEEGSAGLNIDLPYLQFGKDKLIRNTSLAFTLSNPDDVCNLSMSTRWPGQKGATTFMLEANAADNRIDTDLSWIMDRPTSYRGLVALSTTIDRTEDNKTALHVDVNPSQFEVNDSIWKIGKGEIDFVPGRLTVKDINVERQDQYAFINGVASTSPGDVITVDLQDINLDYIFETLNINYVVFGGDATGRLQAADLFTGHPKLFTDDLKVKNLTYNNSRLGDASIKSSFDTEANAVKIKADIDDRNKRVASVDGAVWVTRDSLSFGFKTDDIDVGFLKPFVAAFCDGISGHASGECLLYGTFKDINLKGKVYADNVKMRIGVTNTEYTASDSVLLTPGKIHLDNITLRDREGHTAKLNGYVTHEYFHNPTFKFSLSDAKDFLCYDTNARINPVWYGTIYANGSGTITGVPGFIDVLVDMTTAPNSTFTFVIDDAEEAVEYQFLTFTDKRKEAEELRIKELMQEEDTEPEFVKQFEKKAQQQKEADIPTRYKMDLRINATPDAKAIIVMDPAAGDRIRAAGEGALRFTYNSEGEMGLYGTYTIESGDYNFTLQELIVRDFKIRRDSKITFTGDPLNAVLDITAAYRVNASLTDLDKSFATDNDLNRNKVPVEALLKVSGNMQSPDIDFDIDFPTLNQDVVRKVRSIVSTEDMMNMQMVYLLALNRFYTPDYMNGESYNNEMASLASATLSTQLANILGQISDNWSFAPSFGTRKGDFSDMEVDLALSSTLLNNRLIINGNLGYRDKATSSTTFVGDFDVEYLLNPKGTLRLKAYNHYNDQNYYLRSALTTQGIGVVFKKDFTDFLPGIFGRKSKKTKVPEPAKADSTPQNKKTKEPQDNLLNFK